MYTHQFLDDKASNTLENTRRTQEEKKLAMLREQKTRDLHELETQLFYKKQEVLRLKTLSDRLRRDAVVKQSTQLKEEREALRFEQELRETEKRISQLDKDVTHSLSEITEKISREKAIINEHQKNIDALEKEKREMDSKKGMSKRSLTESLSRLFFFKKKEENESQRAKKVFETNQKQLDQAEHSFKTFNQEVHVLENKIRALRSVVK